MYNLRARYYDAGNGSFVERDVYDGKGFDPQTLHKYVYAGADPVSGKDPSGQFTVIELMITVAIIAVVAALVIPAISKAINKGKGSALQGELQSLLANNPLTDEQAKAEIRPEERLQTIPNISIDVGASQQVGAVALPIDEAKKYNGAPYTVFIRNKTKKPVMVFNGKFGTDWNAFSDKSWLDVMPDNVGQFAVLVREDFGVGQPAKGWSHWYCAYAGRNQSVFVADRYYNVPVSVTIGNDQILLWPSGIPTVIERGDY